MSNQLSSAGSDDGVKATSIQTFGDELMFDIEGSYLINENLTLSAGVRNLFDNYPDVSTNGDVCCVQVYDSVSVVDWQGGYYYTCLAARF